MAQTLGRWGLGLFFVTKDGKKIQFGIGYKS